MNRKAIIFGIKSFKLTHQERLFLKKNKPWGIILFSRNIKSLYQLKSLIKDIKEIFSDYKYPILIDQEGGRVSRLNNIIDFSVFTQECFCKLYKKDKDLFLKYYKIYISTVSSILNEVGININTVPVLDVINKKTHNIIGDRSFSSNAEIVSFLGDKCIDFYHKKKIFSVMKHIPGHGQALCDSHHKTPIINAKKKELVKKDFLPFKKCETFFAMTAHAVYKNFDSKNTATHSSIVINEVIRKIINFKGILISDDISMKALKLSLVENAIKSLEAGCNLVLHCNGNIHEMNKLAKFIPNIDKFTQKKTSQFYKYLG